MEDKNIKVPHRKYINPETDLLYKKKNEKNSSYKGTSSKA